MAERPPGGRGVSGIPLTRVPLFALGRLVATPRALHLLIQAGDSVVVLLARHALGDWGDLDPGDRARNDAAIRTHERILSEYTANGERIWIITEADRSATYTLLLPSEY